MIALIDHQSSHDVRSLWFIHVWSSYKFYTPKTYRYVPKRPIYIRDSETIIISYPTALNFSSLWLTITTLPRKSRSARPRASTWNNRPKRLSYLEISFATWESNGNSDVFVWQPSKTSMEFDLQQLEIWEWRTMNFAKRTCTTSHDSHGP